MGKEFCKCTTVLLNTERIEKIKKKIFLKTFLVMIISAKAISKAKAKDAMVRPSTSSANLKN